MSIRKIILVVMLSAMLLSLVGCEETTRSKMDNQAEKKAEQAVRMIEQSPTPSLDRSLERENIVKRLKITNDPNTLQWIYPMSAGRVIGRFPVLGKITSGSKKLTPDTDVYNSNRPMPDEMGAYGSSGDYVFWFDPAGRGPFQHRGDYFVTPVPYKIDLGYGTITYEIDTNEESKRNVYEGQIKNNKINGGK